MKKTSVLSDRKLRYGLEVVITSWIAVFCLFGYRAIFAVIKDSMSTSLGWNQAQVSLGYSLMMLFYAITAFFSGLLLDRFGTRPAYSIASVFAFLGFFLTSYTNSYYSYLLAFGLLGGIATGMLWVTSTVSIRKWFVGKKYATIWGLAFIGAPVSQLILANLTNSIMKDGCDDQWRIAMRLISFIILAALILAAILAKKNPEAYNFSPFGLIIRADSDSYSKTTQEKNWFLKDCFSRYAIWAVILTFLFSMMAEFLIWTQIVSYWRFDKLWSSSFAIRIYSLIGLAGIVTMPLMGYLADRLVHKSKSEAAARKKMLVLGAFIGLTACILLLMAGDIIFLSILACFLFATYWAIIPGGVVGYTGAVYGSRNLGKIWGLATLIVMGIGPFTGTFVGGWLKDISGVYRYSIMFSLFSFMIAIGFALSLPQKAE
jgi:MFS transporter, OFA family, oxalate/formate antiporter